MVSQRSAVISSSGGRARGKTITDSFTQFHHLISDHAFQNKINFLGYLINQKQVIAVGANPGRHNEISVVTEWIACPCWSWDTSCRPGCKSTWDLPFQPFPHHHTHSGSHSHKGFTPPFIRNKVKAIALVWLILGVIFHHSTISSWAHIFSDHYYQSHWFKI